MIVAIVISSVILFLLILFFIMLYGLYRYTFYSPKKGQNDDYNLYAPMYRGHEEEIIKLIDSIRNVKPYEDVFIKSFDKLKLHARVYKNKNSRTVAILCHGYRGTAYRDFSGGAKEVIEMGYNVILIDERAHGQSEGHSITFGIREVEDLISWVKYAKERFGEDIKLVLIGISMGGATVLMASDKVGKAKIIADAPYTSPKIMLSETIKSIKLPVKIFYPILNLSAIIFAHTNMNKLSAYDAIKNTTNDVLIIHGDSDGVVPHHISYELYQAYPDKIQYELFPNTDHGFSYIIDYQRYKKLLVDFLNKD